MKQNGVVALESLASELTPSSPKMPTLESPVLPPLPSPLPPESQVPKPASPESILSESEPVLADALLYSAVREYMIKAHRDNKKKKPAIAASCFNQVAQLLVGLNDPKARKSEWTSVASLSESKWIAIGDMMEGLAFDMMLPHHAHNNPDAENKEAIPEFIRRAFACARNPSSILPK